MKKNTKLLTAISTAAITLSLIAPAAVSVSAAQSIPTTPPAGVSNTNSDDWNNADNWTPDQISSFFNTLQPEKVSISEINTAENNVTDPTIGITIHSPKQIADAKKQLLTIGFTQADLTQLTSKDIIYLSEQSKLPQTRIGASTVAKAVVKVWKRLPSGVRSAIGKYAGLKGLISAIDHFTGTEYHIIYSALRYIGIPANIADLLTKTITLFI